MLVYFSLFAAWFILFIMGAVHYKGTTYIYVLFSLIYLALIVSGFFWRVTYGYTFFSVMLWLGFWLKTVLHLLLDYPFVEPTGLFNDSGKEWDEVLFVATIGALGTIVARIIYSIFIGGRSTINIDICPPPPEWYKPYRVFLWSALTACMIFFSLLNIVFSFQQIGLVPKTIIWPLNSIFSWLLSTGFAIAVATLLWWEFSLKRTNINFIYFLLLEAATSSVSLLSRGLYIFHIIPIFFSIFSNRKLAKTFTTRWSALLLGSTLIIYLFCYPIINSVRDYHYSEIPLSMPSKLKISSMKDLIVFFEKGAIKLAKFSVDRWIGVEGLMATSAYTGKDLTLFLSVATEKSEIGKVSKFQEIAKSDYRFSDLTKFLFASLPGPISFFYLTNNLYFVMAGMSFLSLLILTSEVIIYKLLLNPFLAALWGSIISTTAVQMGINLPGLVFYLLLCLFGFFSVYLLQKLFYLESISFRKRKI